MCRKKMYLSPVEAEEVLTKERVKKQIVGTIELELIANMVEDAQNSKNFGDKVIMNIKPIYVHVPKWQRKLNINRAREIGEQYNPYKWEIPKVLYSDGKLIIIDGMHRVFGAFLGNLKSVLVEVLTGMTEREAINLFLEQGDDRRRMSPSDIYGASLVANKPEYIRLKKICTKNHVAVKGDIETISNPIGVLTSITDGVGLARSNPELLDRILVLLEKLQWNAGKSIYDGKAYSAKVIRVLKKLYAYYDGKEEQMEHILINVCKGSQYFNDNIVEKWQDSLFDYLADIVEKNLNIAVVGKTARKGRSPKTA